MPRKTPDEGVEPFEYRPGLGFRYFRGMNRSADPGAVPANQFHLLSNVRLTPAGMTDRPGMVPHHDTGVAGCITGMIEIDEDGVGLWVTRAYSTINGDTDETILGNFNEQRGGAGVQLGGQYTRFNRRDTDIAGQDSREPPFVQTALYSADIIVGQKTLDYKVSSSYPADGGSWVSFIKYRKRLLQFGYRERQKEDEEDEQEYVVCLYEVKLPTKDETLAGYELYRDLWVVADPPTAAGLILDAVTVFKRSQEELAGDEQVREIMYIARNDGTVWSFDGTTLQEEYDFGAAYALRLGVFNGQGVLAIGSNGSAAVARFLAAPGGTWTAVSLPEADLRITDITPWNGSLYLVSTLGGQGPRIYRFQGGSSIPAYIYEFPWVDGATVGDTTKAGMFLQYRNTLYVTEYVITGFGNKSWYLRKWVNDSTWTQLPTEINFTQDHAADVYWMHVAGGRVFMGALAVEAYWAGQVGSGNSASYFTEISNFNTTDGPTVTPLYPSPSGLPTPPTVFENVGTHVITHAPEDAVLNDEEL